MSEKTEAPTPRRLRRAREQGQLAKSRLFSGAAVTFAALAAGVAAWPRTAAELRRWTEALFTDPSLEPAAALRTSVWLIARASVAPLAAALVASVAASIATAGFSFRPALVAPKLERIDPFGGLKKLFTVRQLIDVAKGMLIIALLAWILWSGARELGPAALRLAPLPWLLERLSSIVLKAAAVLLALGVADLWLARRRQWNDLKMTRQEVKQEHKESEGDPRHKAQRKAQHRQLAAGGPARGIAKATAVVVNPTHLAIGLRYDPAECDAPYLVAKGRESDALRLRAQAKQLGIPIVRDVPLARTLIHYDVGEELPEELYRAAAAVLQTAAEQRNPPPSPTEKPKP